MRTIQDFRCPVQFASVGGVDLQCSTPTYLGLLLCTFADQYGVVVLHKGSGRRDHTHNAVEHARSVISSDPQALDQLLSINVSMETTSRDSKLTSHVLYLRA